MCKQITSRLLKVNGLCVVKTWMSSLTRLGPNGARQTVLIVMF